MIHIKVVNLSLHKKAYSPIRLKKIAEKILEEEGFEKKDYELSLVFCDDEFIQNLNKIYRKKDTPTDVLSFSVPKNFPVGEVSCLGEIVISLETVFNKYADNPEKAKQEIYLLFCHALLHLLGYVHDTTQ
ncbi:MAG: rRNA maturation RNase YbeY, partial [Candidatus Hydrogenedens sp.]